MINPPFSDETISLSLIGYYAIESRISPNLPAANLFHVVNILAETYGLDLKQRRLLCAACAYHDIGMSLIPDYLLSNKSVISTEEKDILADHTLNGRDIILETVSDISISAAEIALSHHERYDGSGYPYGLTGQEIPFFSRLFAVADVFDALCSKRFHREAFCPDEAFELITCAHKFKFDPEILDNFRQCFNKLKGLYVIK